uniref:Uncharacterized protein n=1 Tax=Arundo donax TaxID=35708 RepID=A0A0A9GNZ1_ARUDO
MCMCNTRMSRTPDTTAIICVVYVGSGFIRIIV